MCIYVAHGACTWRTTIWPVDQMQAMQIEKAEWSMNFDRVLRIKVQSCQWSFPLTHLLTMTWSASITDAIKKYSVKTKRPDQLVQTIANKDWIFYHADDWWIVESWVSQSWPLISADFGWEPGILIHPRMMNSTVTTWRWQMPREDVKVRWWNMGVVPWNTCYVRPYICICMHILQYCLFKKVIYIYIYIYISHLVATYWH